ncbi:MAG TPA: hypothetical protein VIC27_09300 [Ktedonobacterales bacterium]
MESFNALGFSAMLLALAAIVGFTAPRRSAAFWAWIGAACALVLCAIALPIGLAMLP